MKYHISQNDNGMTICTLPFIERVAGENNIGGGANSISIEVAREDAKKITDSSLINIFKNGELSFEPRPILEKTDEEVKKDQLKNKIKNDTATLTDIKEYLKLTIQ